jgi:hypothetical protein
MDISIFKSCRFSSKESPTPCTCPSFSPEDEDSDNESPTSLTYLTPCELCDHTAHFHTLPVTLTYPEITSIKNDSTKKGKPLEKCKNQDCSCPCFLEDGKRGSETEGKAKLCQGCGCKKGWHAANEEQAEKEWKKFSEIDHLSSSRMSSQSSIQLSLSPEPSPSLLPYRLGHSSSTNGPEDVPSPVNAVANLYPVQEETSNFDSEASVQGHSRGSVKTEIANQQVESNLVHSEGYQMPITRRYERTHSDKQVLNAPERNEDGISDNHLKHHGAYNVRYLFVCTSVPEEEHVLTGSCC